LSAVALHHAAAGSGLGTPVVLVHAIGCDHAMWDEVLPALEQRRVIAVDLRGHGASPVPAGPYTLEGLAQDIAALLDRLGIDRADWVGLSLGGMVGQAFALGHPARLRRLVIANSTSGYGPEGRGMWLARAKAVEDGGMGAILDMAMGRYFSDSFRRERPEVVERIARRFLATDPRGYAGCCRAIADLAYTGRLGAIAAPTLVIAGGADVATTPQMAAAIAEGIPHASLEVIAGVSHLGAVEAPQRFGTLVGRFLAA
jgi:3-oxoadipate enol-lactonase